MVNVLYTNDNLGAYPESYYAATADFLEPFAPLTGEREVDVCIIGGGFSGLSAALHLKQKGYDVALLDAHRVGWGASGRNGGQVGSGQRLEQEELIDLVGADHARDLWNVSEDAKSLVSSLIRDHNIDCDYRRGILYANHRARYDDESRRHVELLQSAYGYDKIRYVGRDEMRSLLATQAYHGGTYDANGMHLHPLRYVLGLAKACAEAGVENFECSEATEIVEGKTLHIKTRAGRIKAKYAVLAGNGYLGCLNRHTADRVMPINNYIIVTEPLPVETAKALIANDAAVADSKFVINYYRLSEDNRLIFGGRESYRYRFPTDIKSYVRKAMLEIYPQLADAKIDFGWGGTLGITMNRMPHFEWLSPNMITIGGYSGHGIALATMGGALAAEAISGTAERFDVMARVPTKTIPGGHAARLPLLALGMAYYSLRDRL